MKNKDKLAKRAALLAGVVVWNLAHGVVVMAQNGNENGNGAEALPQIELANLEIPLVEQAWGTPGRNVSVSGQPLSIAGQRFAKGFGTHAPGKVSVECGGAKRFTAWVGVDDGANERGSVEFAVDADDMTVWTSGVMKRGMPAQKVEVDLTGVKVLVLRTGDAGDGNSNDHANWVNAAFQGGAPKILPRTGPAKDVPVWLDTRGTPIQAHGGGILRWGDTYYWYGEDKSKGANNKVGVAGYKSKDLANWEPMGIVMPASGFPEKYRDQGVCERPKVIYNSRTKKYVLWAHLDADNYRAAEAGVCLADRPEGPFQFVRAFRPVPTSHFRDMNLWVEEDGTAYVIYSGEDNATMHIARLNRDYTDVEGPLEEGKNFTRTLVRQWREAPAPFKVGNKYYLLTSGCSGWNPNPSAYATADSMLGPWTSHENPFTGPDANLSFRSQPTFVLPNPYGKQGDFIYMGDRWNGADLANSRYIWLPFTVGADGKFQITWREGWRPGE